MRITVVGTGYVGIVTAACFAKKGHDVFGLDIDVEKIKKISEGEPPIYEPGLKQLIKTNINRNLRMTIDYRIGVRHGRLIIVCVPTPSKKNGATDLRFIEEVAREIGKEMKSLDEYKVVVIKSTVPPGTTEYIGRIIERLSGKKIGKDFGLAMNPEFLREGRAVRDFLNPDRIVIGGVDRKSIKMLKRVYNNFNCPIIECDIKTAELIKYASNALLALKVSFANEIGNLCKKLSIDVYDVMKGVGLDYRIGRYFLDAGIGFGGSCFPKDVHSLINTIEKNGESARITRAIIDVNKRQPLKIIKMIERKIGKISKRNIVVLGLAFKPDTDDIREAPSIKIINVLLSKNANVIAYDPKAMQNTEKIFKNSIKFAKSAKEAVSKGRIILILTEWEEFKNPNLYKNKIVFDGRYILEARKTARYYEGVCW